MKYIDFFDVIFLMGQTDFNYDYLKVKLSIGSRLELKAKLLSAATEKELINFAKDVEPFLVKQDEKERILSFRQYIKQEL